MKRIMLITSAILLIGVLLIVVPLADRFSTIQYTKNLEMSALLAGGKDGYLQAECAGVTTKVVEGNIGRVTRMLTLTELSRVHFERPHTPELTLTYSDGTVLTLAQDEKKEDRVVISAQNQNGKSTFAIEGYRVMDAVRTAVSPEGFSGANVLLEGE